MTICSIRQPYGVAQSLPDENHPALCGAAPLDHHPLRHYLVSTPYLANKYAHLNPDVVPAQPTPLLLAVKQPVKIAYHGSSSHQAKSTGCVR